MKLNLLRSLTRTQLNSSGFSQVLIAVVTVVIVILAVAGVEYVLATRTSTSPVPTVSIASDPNTVTSGYSSTIRWSSNNATSCTASGDWSGSKATSGSFSTGAIKSTKIYSLSCTGSGGRGDGSTSVSVTAQT